MAIPLNILSGTSNTPIRTVGSGTNFATLSRTPPVPPQQAISPIDKLSGSALAFPSDRGKYYMRFDIYQYERNSLFDLGRLSPSGAVSQVMLPLPATLQDVTEVQWDDNVQLGNPITGVAELIGKAGISSVLKQARYDRVLGAIGGAVGSGVDAASAFFGYAPNQFITLLFRGPTYKKHHFLWSFSPHNQREADTLRQIAMVFKNSMSPKPVGIGGLFWQYPKIFWPAIIPNSMFMYKFKPMVLNKFAVNYTGGGKPAFYKNSEPSHAAPEGLIFDMAFTEIEYWTEGNFNSNVDPYSVYTTSADFNPGNSKPEPPPFPLPK